MDYEELNILTQSRKTLLKILAGRGYKTEAYEGFGPIEIGVMATTGQEAFRMDFERSEESLAAAPSKTTKCRVVYTLGRIKNRIQSFLTSIIGEEDSEDRLDPATTELIIITLEPVVETFHAAAIQEFKGARHLRVSFFQAHTLFHNPLENALVPKHELVPQGEHETFMKKFKIKSKRNLPYIKFHEDMIARVMGLVPDDIVKITRPSPQAGEYETYRLCVV